ncbi:MAG: hypothetical protein HQ562_10790 [Candidatus Marinimicrobia bacterium]|nr:hypothetical protein [Candidatus Neomarinimicrobiota bacterium]
MNGARIITKQLSKSELRELCAAYFKTFVKFVVDIKQGIMSVGGELHADGEALLIEQGSNQSNLWGANFYPGKTPLERLEYTVLINIRPRDNNFGMEISDPAIQSKVKELAEQLLLAADDSLA